MKPHRKHLLLASLLAATGTLALAQAPAAGDAPARPGWSERRAERMDPARMQQRMAERHAQRMDKLKAELKLNPTQEGAWTQFSTAMQPPAFEPRGPGARADFAKLSTPERIDLMQKRADERHARMKQRGDATKAFYAQLTPEQQQSFDRLAARGRHGAGWHAGHREHRGWGPGMGPGPR